MDKLGRLSDRESTWDIDAALKRFVNDPHGLRETLRDIDGLISGGFALQFLAGTQWAESDLDICVHQAQGQHLAAYLTEKEGYDLASRKIGKYNWSEIEEVHAYDKPTADPKIYKTIEIIFTKQDPIRSVLTECYTTALVNVISYDAAYSVFPVPTLIDKLTFILKEPDHFHNVLLEKYRLRGYQDLQRLPNSVDHVDTAGCFLPASRRVGDSRTWKVPLPGVTPSRLPNTLERVCFEIHEGEQLVGHNLSRWMVLRPVD